jgi:predicted metal-dependent enzyme (double-stranded beta helix superfamily)
MPDAVKAERNAMVSKTIARIRTIEKDQGVSRETLEEIRGVLLDLATHRELFPEEDFPAEANDQGFFPIYRLAEDDDHRLALYMSTSVGAKDVPPHDHTTWAVIVAVQGTEENRFYERVGDFSAPGQGQIRQTGGELVRPGVGVCLMPDDIHSIHPNNARPALILHMYGQALDHLPNRVTYNMAEGTYKVFPATPNIREAR